MPRKNICISIRFNKDTMPLYDFLKARKNTTAFIIDHLEQSKEFRAWKKMKSLAKQIEKIEQESDQEVEAIIDKHEKAPKTPENDLTHIQTLQKQYKAFYGDFMRTKDKEAIKTALGAKYELEKLIGEQETAEFCKMIEQRHKAGDLL